MAFRYLRVPMRSTQVSDNDFPSHLPDLTAQVVGSFPVAFRYLRVPVLGTQLFDQHFPGHLPDLNAKVVGQFPCSQMPLDICVY
ncbi:hypothetical protein GBA52_024957 [Prunus armeniaca]|nr:hypothetical protein GBA52_024957 [Prunus armeniaca]